MSAKRALDLLAGSIALVFSLPILLAAALAIRISGDVGPILYRASRIGEGGRPFAIVKLRTMADNAGGAGVTSSRDPRVTKVGRVLRRLKIDELPQLWNVLRGEMSLVGPRPEDKRYVNWTDPVHQKVFTAKPGITGLAQLEYPLEEDLLVGTDPERIYREQILPSKLKLDSYYLDHQSLLLDLRILARTASTTIRPLRGAFVTAFWRLWTRCARLPATAVRLAGDVTRAVLLRRRAGPTHRE
jgi:lipopolysaccharide/colanic/teichoic acid biosynthesis glycosyltransferase